MGAGMVARKKQSNPNKTKATTGSVSDFLSNIGDETRRSDCAKVVALMERITGEPPTMWGSSIVGFGSYHYRYESGREGNWFRTGFSPRKNDLTIYCVSGVKRHPELLKKLGKFKTGVSCLYLKRLADVDLKVLENLIESSIKEPMGRLES